MLRAAGYEVVDRPGDGACFFWSYGTTCSHFTRDSFGATGKQSPLGRASADAVAKQEWLQAQRDAVVAQLRNPAFHFGKLRNEPEYWEAMAGA